jgi:hypothetical protein
MPTRNPRVNESFVQVFLNGQLVGTFGPYQTMRAALADAKTLAISRRDNRAANGGIDAMVHTYKDAQGKDLGYSVVARKKDAELPHLFEAYAFVSANRPAAQSGRDYTQQAQQERVVRFNGKKKPARKKAAKNPQVEFTAHGKPVSFFARKTKGK